LACWRTINLIYKTIFGPLTVRFTSMNPRLFVEEFRNRRHFPSNTANCRFSNIIQRLTSLEKLTNMDAKGAKRSVKMWTKNFYKSFSKNMLLHMSSRLSKIRSVHTYVIPRTVYFGWICSSIFRICSERNSMAIYHIIYEVKNTWLHMFNKCIKI